MTVSNRNSSYYGGSPGRFPQIAIDSVAIRHPELAQQLRELDTNKNGRVELEEIVNTGNAKLVASYARAASALSSEGCDAVEYERIRFKSEPGVFNLALLLGRLGVLAGPATMAASFFLQTPAGLLGGLERIGTFWLGLAVFGASALPAIMSSGNEVISFSKPADSPEKQRDLLRYEELLEQGKQMGSS